MSITLILAASQNGVIGKDNKIPWRLRNDLKHFKKETLGKDVVMGRKTWDSLPDAFKPLPDRNNIVLTRDTSLVLPGNVTVMRHAELIVENKEYKEWMIAGGAEIYRYFLPFADHVVLTLVEKDYDGDAFFHDFTKPNWNVGWQLIEERVFCADEYNDANYRFLRFNRIRDGILEKKE